MVNKPLTFNFLLSVFNFSLYLCTRFVKDEGA